MKFQRFLVYQEIGAKYFNKEKQAEDALFELINDLKAKIILLSYNCEGFVKKEKFLKRLQSLGKCQIFRAKIPDL